MAKTITVSLVKSTTARLKKHKLCVRGLGLKRIGHKVTLEDTPAVRGMITKVHYLLKIEE